MSNIVIGHNEQGKNISLDLEVLIRTRLLVQANSGGGKSFALRRILEQAFGKVQCIVIDPAGEFATLREKFGYVLVGKGGETPADIRSAGLVAEKLLELRASAVCDLYGLKPHERPLWVKKFLSAVMNVPKKLWHPVFFVVDEAHKFCPEKGEGESEAKPEMLELASDGRKYGFCAIFATQRLAKLDKSAAAELLNVLVGPTFIDIDLERAHKALGIVRSDWRDFDAQMKIAEPGQFWALGRAISTNRVLVRIGGIETTHPEAGSGKHAAEPPPAPDKVRELLPKLADLPQAAEEKARSMAELQHEVRQLKAQLKAQPKPGEPAPVEVPVLSAADREALDHFSQRVLSWNDGLLAAVNSVRESASLGGRDCTSIAGLIVKLLDAVSHFKPIVSPRGASIPQNSRPASIGTLPPAPRRSESIRVDTGQDGTEGEKLTGPEQRIVDAIAWENVIGIDEPSQVAVAFLAGYTYGAGGFNNAKGSCNTKGLVRYIPGDRIALTDLGKRRAVYPDGDLTTEELHKRVLSRLKNPEQRILKPLLEAYPNALPDEELGKLANYEPGTGGFNNPKGRLRSLGLIEYPQPKHAVASKILFLE